MKKYKIGYVDEDPKQVIKYERDLRDYFDVIGYDIKQGTELSELLDQIYKSDIDLLLVDFLMVDKGIVTFNGDEVVRQYEDIMPGFPKIIFTNEESQAFPQVDDPNIIYDKSLAKSNKAHLAEILRKNIEVYKNYINKRSSIIAELLLKGEEGDGLSAGEKHVLLQSQIELINLDKRSNEVPFQLLDNKKLDSISKTTKEAEDFLESIIKKMNDETI